MGDDRGHTPDTGELRLTYAQLGARLRISSEAARQLARRRGWRRILPNRLGAPAIVIVPEDELSGELWRHERETDPDVPRSTTDVQDLPYGDAERERARADQAEQRAVRAEQRADEAVQLAKAALARADRAEERAEEANKRAEIADVNRRAAEAGADAERTRADQAEEDRRAAEGRADALREKLDHTERDLAVVRHDAEAAQQAAAELRLAEEARKARGRLRRAWDGWRGR
jgi:hypothetical protein